MLHEIELGICCRSCKIFSCPEVSHYYFYFFGMDSIIVVTLLGDVILNSLRFPFFRFIYFVRYMCTLAAFQCLVHIYVSKCGFLIQIEFLIVLDGWCDSSPLLWYVCLGDSIEVLVRKIVHMNVLSSTYNRMVVVFKKKMNWDKASPLLHLMF